ncbi:hypothetical protein RR48_10344 [Papilio machaon]|uniref:Uncharacterized protein n=1 Tax=Papilio machaon TaxID=76193 RepID=A0A194RHE6_PAPMA|nr:hypothetical protein RR48_10344 [Papilio machaon]
MRKHFHDVFITSVTICWASPRRAGRARCLYTIPQSYHSLPLRHQGASSLYTKLCLNIAQHGESATCRRHLADALATQLLRGSTLLLLTFVTYDEIQNHDLKPL